MTGLGSTVRLLVTLTVPTDEVVYSLFAARSPDSVLDVYRQAGLPPQRFSSDVGARIEQCV